MTWADLSALRLAAARVLSAADRQEQAGRRLQRTTVGVAGSWRGEAAGAAVSTLERLQAGGARVASALDDGATVLLTCAARVEEAQGLRQRAQDLERQDTEERAAATARGQFVPPYDSPLQQQARRLTQQAEALAAEASARAAAQLRELAAPVPQVLTTGDQLRAVGPAAGRAIWGSFTTIADLSRPRALVDGAGWRGDVRSLLDGGAHAWENPGEAARALVGWDLLADGRYGEWVGGVLPDAVSGVFSGGVLPVTRRTAGMAEDLADLAEDVDDLQRVSRRMGAGGPVEPRAEAVMTERCPAAVLDLEPERRRHILYGDPPDVRGGKGGGHRAGTGKGKSEFPARWTDDDIIRFVMDTARRPERTRDQDGRTTMLADAVHEGVEIRVVVAPDGRIVTAYPLRGPGVHLPKGTSHGG